MTSWVGRIYRLPGAATIAPVLFAAVLAIAALAPAVAAASDMGKDKFKVGEKAPDFTVADLDGKQSQLAALAGQKVLLLNFWGLRCGACLEEMPFLEDIWKRYAGKGLAVWGLNTDGVDPKTVVDTLKEVNVSVTYPLLLDQEFKVTDVYTNFLVPLTLVIDKAGTITYIHTGFEKGTEKNYEAAVKKALGI
jgi:peroxiredoxin